ncbi:MAG: hypothetical protein Kow0077_10980 [Anaerolineae bacterium]
MSLEKLPVKIRNFSLLLGLATLLAVVACKPAASDLTPIAAVSNATPTRLALDGPPPTATPTATVTPVPVLSSTATQPGITPSPLPTRTPIALQASTTLVTPLPSPLPVLPDSPETDVFLLIGTDAPTLARITRTDAILLVAVHRTGGAVTLLSIPRDLYVAIPTRGMDRINTAFAHGEQTGYPGGGAALLRDTIAYNLGIHAPIYARIDFSGFETLIDALGGVEVTVPCALQDWALKPGGNPANEDDWAMLTLPAGVHQLDGRTALWYVRSRRTSTDLDRGRRQQDVLRAIGEAARRAGWLEAVPGLWELFTRYVDTNLTLDQALTLAPLALTLDISQINRRLFLRDEHYRSWTTPGGEAVLLPIGDAVAALAADFLTSPTANQLVLRDVRVAILNHSGQPGMARIAAYHLAWNGLPATYDDSGGGSTRTDTVIYDLTGRQKDSPLAALQSLLDVDDAHVITRPDPNRTIDFRVELGSDYDPCIYPVLPPR